MTCVVSSSFIASKELLDIPTQILEKYDLEIGKNKTAWIYKGENTNMEILLVENGRIKKVPSFICLESIIIVDGAVTLGKTVISLKPNTNS